MFLFSDTNITPLLSLGNYYFFYTNKAVAISLIHSNMRPKKRIDMGKPQGKIRGITRDTVCYDYKKETATIMVAGNEDSFIH